MAVSVTGGADPQYLLSCPPSLNMVPPTATLKGVEARKFTDSGKAAAGEPGSSQPAAPLSPVETRYEMPCAAACSARALVPFTCASVAKYSQLPKLSVITSARLFSTM